MRRLPGGADAVERAAAGDASSLAEQLRSSMASWTAALKHAAAIYFERLALERERALPKSGQLSASALAAAAHDATLRRVAAWIALADDGTFVRELASRVAGGAVPAAVLDGLAEAAVDRALTELGGRARGAVTDLGARGAAALHALGRIREACKLAGASGATTKRVVALAERAAARAVDEALAPLADELREAQARGAPAAELVASMSRVRAVWEWSGHDEAVERFALDQVTDPAWEIYRRVAWPELRALLAPCEPLYESMEARILARPSELAYAASCAQTLVFRSELETDREREWAFAERALRLCPTHRNGRLVMADLLSARALALLSRTTAPTARRDVAEATELLARAEAAFAGRARTKEAQGRLDDTKRRWGIGA
ncbi:MAG: hypothetical protein IPM79_24530 [Polyangiaceae bacterium]|nr:hypothetical protein [Polyangiaceae bacterium]